MYKIKMRGTKIDNQTSPPFLEIWIVFPHIWGNTIHISKNGGENGVGLEKNGGRNGEKMEFGGGLKMP